jgi:uncharacterized membrane protein
MLQRMLHPAIIKGGLVGGLAACLLAAIPTFRDWQTNPGGLFRDLNGTHWEIVFETAFSWLWPLVLLTVPIGVAIGAWMTRRSGRGRR